MWCEYKLSKLTRFFSSPLSTRPSFSKSPDHGHAGFEHGDVRDDDHHDEINVLKDLSVAVQPLCLTPAMLQPFDPQTWLLLWIPVTYGAALQEISNKQIDYLTNTLAKGSYLFCFSLLYHSSCLLQSFLSCFHDYFTRLDFFWFFNKTLKPTANYRCVFNVIL